MIGKITYSSQPVPLRESKETAANQPMAAVESQALSPLQQAREEAAQHNDVDMSKVAKAKAMLKAGNTSVDLDSLADKMMGYYQGDK